MFNIAVLGDKESVMGFASLGMRVFPVDDKEDAVKILEHLDDGSYAIIYITEKLGRLLSDELARYNDLVTPAVILIPGVRGNTGDGLKNLSKSVERAVGSDILSD